MEPEQPSPDTEQEPHLPRPTLYPIGFAIGIVVILVGLVIDPLLISSIGAGIAIVFAYLWARDDTAELRDQPVAVVPERREAPATEQESIAVAPLGALIGGLITVPIAAFTVLPGFLRQEQHKVDLGPLSNFTLNDWFITTFIVDPAEGEVSSRTAFIRNNGNVADSKGKQVPSFTIISNRCTHLGCPTQANGPSGKILGKPTVHQRTLNGTVALVPVVPAGYGCPCHGSQFDPEGNRTAGPAPRALDRYEFEIDNGHLILLSTYSVTVVDGTGGQAVIHKYKEAGPGEHIDGPEQVLYPLQPPHH